jgi:hypothetical protein
LLGHRQQIDQPSSSTSTNCTLASPMSQRQPLSSHLILEHAF